MSIKTVGLSAAIFCAGAATGAYAAYKFMQKYIDDTIHEETIKIREFYSGIGVDPNPSSEVEDDIVDEYTPPAPIYEEEEPELPDEYIPPRKTMREVATETAPFLISEEAYSEELPHYDKITLCYFENDDTLTDENEEIVSDPVRYLGDEALLSFGELSRDPDVVYVRNPAESADYEVIRLSKSYQETVLGIMPEAPKPKKRRATRQDESE